MPTIIYIEYNGTAHPVDVPVGRSVMQGAIDRPNDFIIDRARPRSHLSFGFGVHRCVGNRLAEMQLMILWEEIMKRFPRIELMDEPKRIYSNFIHGIAEMQVRIPA